MKIEVMLVLALLVSLPFIVAENDENQSVELEGKDYECGKLDGVCPKDYGIECKTLDVDCNFIARWFIKFFGWINQLVFKR